MNKQLNNNATRNGKRGAARKNNTAAASKKHASNKGAGHVDGQKGLHNSKMQQKKAEKKKTGKISAGLVDLPIPKKARQAKQVNISPKTSDKKVNRQKLKGDVLKVIPLGGLNEIGKNITLLEYKDQILIVDCGLSFPEVEMYGIDVVIPDFTYLIENAKKVVGLVLTHGHEDHIGAIPYLLQQIRMPIFGTRITLGLVENKLKEHGIKADLRPFTAGDKFRIGNFKVETIRTTHSVADAVCLYIQTPAGTLFHTGDFKIDYTPIDGEPIDLSKFAEIGKRGVDVMLADSTNALKPGYTRSEKVVGQTLDGIFREAEGRIIIATFSSNVHRVQKIIELAAKYGRKFSVSGRSMENVVKLAQELGYLHIPKGTYVELNKANTVDDDKMVIITTGSQGEPMAALSRMVKDEHRNINLKKGDMVILSSTPVPGNEKFVANIVNRLYDKEVQVIYNDIADIHVSGHACQEELKLIHSLIKPRFFMPVHGESRHLIQHGQLAESLGQRKDHIFILSNGDQLSVGRKGAQKFESVVEAGDILVDGLGIGDVGNVVLKDRKLLSESGLIIVSAAVNLDEKQLLSRPEVVSRGFVYVKENEDLMKEAKEIATKAIERALKYSNPDWNSLKNAVREDLRKFIFKSTKRNPIIMPIFIGQ